MCVCIKLILLLYIASNEIICTIIYSINIRYSPLIVLKLEVAKSRTDLDIRFRLAR